MTLGHGSPPNISGATVTEHEFCPTQSCRANKITGQYLCSMEKERRFKITGDLILEDKVTQANPVYFRKVQRFSSQ